MECWLVVVIELCTREGYEDEGEDMKQDFDQRLDYLLEEVMVELGAVEVEVRASRGRAKVGTRYKHRRTGVKQLQLSL
jgi:hypothetical protein